MTPDRIVPVIIGVGEFKNRSQKIEDAIEPMQLMLQATIRALEDTTSEQLIAEELKSNIDSVSIVATWTWPYADLPGLLSEKLGVQPHHKVYSEHGGHQPIKLVDEVAGKIARGECKVAVVSGGEALASLSACAAAKQMPPTGWTTPESGAGAASPLDLSRLGESIGATHSIGLPIHVYALYENGFRAHHRQTIEQNNEESAKLYAEFAKVAAENPFSWSYGQKGHPAETIATATAKNRMICFPYPLLMNAFNNVNLAASCILTSTEYARSLGIPESKWIYPLGGAGTQDSDDFWERPDFHSSPAISRSLRACLEVSGLKNEDVDLFDIYSCFPIVPKLACQHLGIPFTKPQRPITLLGGLTSFGGAGNNYSMHALTAMVRKLRTGHHGTGLILANGGVLTHQHALCVSTRPRRDGSAYPDRNPLLRRVADAPVPTVVGHAEGEAVIETYTVEFKRDGTPAQGFVVGRLASSGHRFVANAGGAGTLEQLLGGKGEPIGRRGWVGGGDGGRNVFVFERGANL